jgi:hypothetical protein
MVEVSPPDGRVLSEFLEISQVSACSRWGCVRSSRGRKKKAHDFNIIVFKTLFIVVVIERALKCGQLAIFKW